MLVQEEERTNERTTRLPRHHALNQIFSSTAVIAIQKNPLNRMQIPTSLVHSIQTRLLHRYIPIATGLGNARILSTSTTKLKHDASSHGPRILFVGLHVGDDVGVESKLPGRQIAANSSGRSGNMSWPGMTCRIRGTAAGPRGRSASGRKTGRGALGRVCLG